MLEFQVDRTQTMYMYVCLTKLVWKSNHTWRHMVVIKVYVTSSWERICVHIYV